MSPLASTLVEAGVKLAATVLEEVAKGADDDRLRQIAAEHTVITAKHIGTNALAEHIVPGFHRT